MREKQYLYIHGNTTDIWIYGEYVNTNHAKGYVVIQGCNTGKWGNTEWFNDVVCFREVNTPQTITMSEKQLLQKR